MDILINESAFIIRKPTIYLINYYTGNIKKNSFKKIQSKKNKDNKREKF